MAVPVVGAVLLEVFNSICLNNAVLPASVPMAVKDQSDWEAHCSRKRRLANEIAKLEGDVWRLRSLSLEQFVATD
jgi:hypothetical protein